LNRDLLQCLCLTISDMFQFQVGRSTIQSHSR
jgi:hypothetical protein